MPREGSDTYLPASHSEEVYLLQYLPSVCPLSPSTHHHFPFYPLPYSVLVLPFLTTPR